MPHTQSRYQQDLGFTDARIRCLKDVTFIGATLAFTRINPGQWGIVLGTPAAQANTFAVNVTEVLMRRSGFGEDLQEQFGGTGIPASAQPQVYRPDVIPAMAALQELTSRTALKVKGFKLLSFDVIYLLGVAAATSHTVRVDQTVYTNNVAPATTAILAVGANGLQTATQANQYTTNVALSAAQQVYRTALDGDLWIEDVITGAATTTVTFYGFDLLVEFNYN